MQLLASFTTVLLVFVVIIGSQGYEKLKQIYSWKFLDFAYPNSFLRQRAIAKGDFIPGGPLPIDVDVYNGGGKKSMVFISVPRFQPGVPVTLGFVTDDVSPEGNPLIAPYPNWEFNTPGDCNHITSVYRMQIDKCNRLWVLDAGRIIEEQVCPPQLHIFNLENKQLISQYKFPRNHYKEASIYVTVQVDVRGSDNNCDDTFAYIADVTGFQMIVYDHRNKDSWFISNNLFYPYPPHGTININNEPFDLMDGIMGLALGPIQSNGDRILQFHSLASTVESWVPTSVIRNGTIFRGNPEGAARSFKSFPKERTSQSAAQAMDRNGILFFGLMTDVAIACWNSKYFPAYGGSNNEMIVVDHETLQFASGIKVVTAGNGRQELWVLTPTFQKFMTGSMTPNETNFRIQAGYIDELVRGTKCDVSSYSAIPTNLQMLSGNAMASSNAMTSGYGIASGSAIASASARARGLSWMWR